MVQGSDGNFYGTTRAGGGTQTYYPYGYGTIFRITSSGTLTTLYIFSETDGSVPTSGMIQGTDGNFYGTTEGGGTEVDGTVFKMTPAGTLITLHSFDGADGSAPQRLVQATNGAFYGTTVGGGVNGDGTVFSLAIGLGGTSPSTTILGLSPASITVGSAGPVVMMATVAPASGNGTPTGAVAFYNGSNEVGTASLSGGTAAFSYNPNSLAINTYQITAIYSGDGTFAISTSSAQTLTVAAISLPTTATPTFSPASGTYSSAQTVTITDTTAGATIYFTNDGTTPTTSSAAYSAPITVDSTQTINAIAAASGYSDSAVATATYSFAPDYQLAVSPSSLTIVAGQSGTAMFTVTPLNGFSSQVSFSCNGLPSEATCSFDPPSVTPSTGSPISSTLTITTGAASAASRRPGASSHFLNYALLIPGLGMIIGVGARRKRAVCGLSVFGMLAVVALVAALTSCGSSTAGNPGSSGTHPARNKHSYCVGYDERH